MQILQDAEQKYIKRDRTISMKEHEVILWMVARAKFQTIIKNNLPRNQFKRDNQEADCLIFRVNEIKYGFCTFMSLMGLAYLRYSGAPSAPGGGPRLVSAPIVIHLDLFKPPCDHHSILALCSGYVRIYIHII